MPSSIPNLNPVVSPASWCLTRSWYRPSFPPHLPAILVDPSPPPTHMLPPSGPTEISDGMEVSDELSVCSDNSYDTYANSTTTPVDPRGSGSRAKTFTDRGGR